ncbi:tail fiber protein [Paenibacillus pini]|uniref:Tail fiber protein n=1 Tax=Paenibacillus pini JCM 16418 TaxID=1236976 RepID=W7YK14_9BACL|nr:phage tail protein [Paenibacillus pini]GAF08033.1 hypothetical protein JCM16418_2070 [Paenibacillus pini JCM 16418]
MPTNTTKLNLLKMNPSTDGAKTFNIDTMLNENWDKVDAAVGKVQEDVKNINPVLPDGTLTQKGIVQLSSATDGARESVAATEKAVKAAYDRGSAGVTAASVAQAKADVLQANLTAHLAENVTDITAINNTLGLKAPLANPVFTGTPKVASNNIVHSGNISSFIPIVDTGNQAGGLFYVDGINGVDSVGRGGTLSPYKTITYCLGQLKKHLTGNVTIRIRAGVYAESFSIENFDGPYNLQLEMWYPDARLSVDLTGYITVNNCTLLSVNFYGIKFAQCIDSRSYVTNLDISSCEFYSTFLYGIIFGGGNLDVSFTNFVNKPTCMSISSAFAVLSGNNTGSGNTLVIDASGGAIITVRDTLNIGASKLFKVSGGAQVFNTPAGVIRTT